MSIESYLDLRVPAAPDMTEHERSYLCLRDVIDAPTMTIHGPPTPPPRAPTPLPLHSHNPPTRPRLTPAELQEIVSGLLEPDLEEVDTVPVPRKRPDPVRTPQWSGVLARVGLGALWVAHLAAIAVACC